MIPAALKPFRRHANKADGYMRRAVAHNLTSKEKHDSREWVVDRTLAWFKPNETIRTLVLPCVYWLYEHMLLKKHPNTEFIAFERDDHVYAKALAHMPGNANGRHPYVEGVINGTPWEVNHTDRAVFIKGRIADLFMDKYHKSFAHVRNQYCNFNAIWLDCFCNITEEMVQVLRALNLVCDPCKPVIPIAVTYQVGREKPDNEHYCNFKCKYPDLSLADQRGAYIADQIGASCGRSGSTSYRHGSCLFVESFRYRGEGAGRYRSNMAVAYCLLIKKGYKLSE